MCRCVGTTESCRGQLKASMAMMLMWQKDCVTTATKKDKTGSIAALFAEYVFHGRGDAKDDRLESKEVHVEFSDDDLQKISEPNCMK